MCRNSANKFLISIVHRVQLWWILKINEHFRPPVGAVKNRTESAPLETAPTKRENGSFVFLTAPVGSVPLILRSTIIAAPKKSDLR